MEGGHTTHTTPTVTPSRNTHTTTRPAEFWGRPKKAPRYDKCLCKREGVLTGWGSVLEWGWFDLCSLLSGGQAPWS